MKKLSHGSVVSVRRKSQNVEDGPIFSPIGKDFCEQYEAVVAAQNKATSSSTRRAAVLDNNVLCVSDAEKEMTEWISYLVMKYMPNISC